MGAYWLLFLVLLLAGSLGVTFGASYVLEHHEKHFGPAVITFGAWVGVALAMLLGIIAYIIATQNNTAPL